MKKILLDTNGYSAFKLGNKEVVSALSTADTVYLSIFVIGELLAGFAGGKRNRENRAQLETFKSIATVKILNATEETSQIFGSVKNALRQAGTPIPTNDIWIAAHALETGAALVSFDKHFSVVPGLRMVDIRVD